MAKGAVAAGHEATVHAAAEILIVGGNAMDAAIAGVLAAQSAEPALTGLFGGGLLNVRHPDGRTEFIDFFARVPGIGRSPSREPLDFGAVYIDFGPTRQGFHIGRAAAAVPRNLAGLMLAHERWGSLPLSEVAAPAIQLAREGVFVSEQMGFIFSLLTPILTHTPSAAAIFAPDGPLLGAGDRFCNGRLADVLESLAADREGTQRELERRLLEQFGGASGLITVDDLARAKPSVETPNFIDYHGHRAILPPKSHIGGGLVALGLTLLSRQPRESSSPTADLLWMAEVQRAMTEARVEPPERFLQDRAVDELEAAIRAAALGGTPTGSTTHISVIDNAGMAVGITHSNGEGCGFMVPGTGIMMNNFLGEEDINPGGFHQQPAGSPMLTMMCPTILEGPDDLMVVGTGGSNRIRSIILQVIHRLVDLGMSLEDAIRAPRVHVEGGVLNVETQGRDPSVVEAVGRAFDEVVLFNEPSMFFGGAHLVRRTAKGFEAYGDSRRSGASWVG